MQKTRDKIRHLSAKGATRQGSASPGPAAGMVNRIIERHPYLRMARDSAAGELERSGEFAEAALKVFKDRLEAVSQASAAAAKPKRKKS